MNNELNQTPEDPSYEDEYSDDRDQGANPNTGIAIICLTLVVLAWLGAWVYLSPARAAAPTAQETIQIESQRLALKHQEFLGKVQEQIMSECVKRGGVPVFAGPNLSCGEPTHWGDKKAGK